MIVIDNGLMEEETLQERQANELEALKAIFTDLFVNCNEQFPEWKPLDVILTVLPLREHSGPSEAHVQLDLHVTACDEYPNKVPKIQIEKHKGLSDKQVAEIKKNLEELAVSKVGEVMVYELVQYVQTVLAEWNKPGFSSFYEEMLSRHEEEKRKEAVRQETEELHKRQLIELEVQGIKKDRQRKKRSKNGKLSEIAEKDDSPGDSPKSKSSVKDNPKMKSQDDDRPDNKLLVEFFDRKSGIHHTVPLLHFNSRLVRDFEILDFIGKGAYGDVLKVRNKLDDCLYAIKRIKLTQSNIAVNKKIMREVKLLSSLNHENVVRYYNSWLENLESEEVHRPELKKDTMKKRDKLLPDSINSSFTFPRVLPGFSDDDDDEEDDDWIEFRNSDNAATDSPDGIASIESDLEELVDTFYNQCMYIQMEYCEKSTLRNAIDDDLYKDESRVWRLLREVVEGLAYIHQQGIIHRDLKPVNLFIDSHDHVKIGDFGLATPNKPSNIKLQNGTSRINLNVHTEEELSDASYTGQVGTALYVAPELNSCAANIHYNQKVDIYSLGIIFFEMCHHPFSTEMERRIVLTNLRLDSIKFPKDFYNDSKMTRQIKLIREFLNHNPSERPTAKEILEKGNLPLAPELENKKLYETISHTLRNPQSKVYKHLIAECFNQPRSEAADITFDETIILEMNWWQNLYIEKMSDIARKIFTMHGAAVFDALLLSPSNGVGIKDGGVVPLMGRCGSLVNLTYDLKLAFARFLAQNSSVSCFKRYTIDKIYRQRRILGTHPREIIECNFDIVSPTSSCLSGEAEVVSVVCEFLDNFDEILHKNCVIRLNHVNLVSAILYQHHVASKKHSPVCSVLSKIKMNDPLSRASATKKLNVFDIPETTVTNLINALNVKIPPHKLFSYYENLMKKSSESSRCCRQAIAQLEVLVEYLQLLKIDYPIVISPSVLTNFNHYSGVMFQVVWERKQKKHVEKDIVIAGGGRYDNLVAQFREALNITTESKNSVFGVTICLEKFASSLPKESLVQPFVDVIVCSLGQNEMLKEKLKLMKELWSAKIRSTVICSEESFEEMQVCCEKMKIPHIIFIKESEPGVAALRSWSKDRYYEKKFSLAEVVPHLCRILRQNSLDTGEQANNTRHHYSRAESRSASVSVSDNRPVSLTFLFDEKLNVSSKRRYENQVSNSISNAVRKLSSKVKIEVIVLKVEYDLIQALVSAVDLNCHDNNSFASLYKKFPKHKKILNRIGDHIETLKSSDISPVIIFYGCLDNNFKILV